MDYSKHYIGLNRAVGQIEGVKRMMDEDKFAPDILTQLRAARSAIKSVEANILECHLQGCVEEAFKTNNVVLQNKKIEELKEIFKRFED